MTPPGTAGNRQSVGEWRAGADRAEAKARTAAGLHESAVGLHSALLAAVCCTNVRVEWLVIDVSSDDGGQTKSPTVSHTVPSVTVVREI